MFRIQGTVTKGVRLAIAISSIIATQIGSADAGLIRVQFEPSSAFVASTIAFSGVEASAAAADPAFGSSGSNAWNHLTIAPAPTPAVSPSFSNLVDTNGVATGVGLSFTGTVYSANDLPVDNNGSDALENEYFLINPTSVRYAITGLAANTLMAFYLYSPNFTHYDSSNSVGQPDRGFTLTANGDTINVPSGTGTGNNALAFVTTDSTGTISGTWSTAGNEGDWSGFQLATATVPELSSLVLAATGVALVLGSRAMGRRRADLRRPDDHPWPAIGDAS